MRASACTDPRPRAPSVNETYTIVSSVPPSMSTTVTGRSSGCNAPAFVDDVDRAPHLARFGDQHGQATVSEVGRLGGDRRVVVLDDVGDVAALDREQADAALVVERDRRAVGGCIERLERGVGFVRELNALGMTGSASTASVVSLSRCRVAGAVSGTVVSGTVESSQRCPNCRCSDSAAGASSLLHAARPTSSAADSTARRARLDVRGVRVVRTPRTIRAEAGGESSGPHAASETCRGRSPDGEADAVVVTV